MLIALVVDMQPPVGNYCRIRRRKCIEFRDSILYPILEWGLLKTESVVQIIEVFKSKNENISDASKILELALNLISKCLSFDFLGAAMENSSETQVTLLYLFFCYVVCCSNSLELDMFEAS